MSTDVLIVIGLTFLIHLISTLSYSVRIVGIRTGRIAVSFALFNVLALISRSANSLQAPLLAKHVERNITQSTLSGTEDPFRWILLAATAATLVGALLIPTFQRLFARAVQAFKVHRSVPRLLFHAFSKAGVRHLRDAVVIPSVGNITALRPLSRLPVQLVLFNVLGVALLSVGVLASLYAGYLRPELRVTCLSLSAVVNGLAVLLMLIFIDPYLSMLTDDVLAGELSDAAFRRTVVHMIGARVVGTLLAQVLLLPGAHAIVAVAEVL